MRPWPIHLATLSFVGLVLAGPAAALHWSGSTFALGACAVTAAVIVADALRCRRVAFGPEGLTIGARTFAWQDIEETHVREVPIARAGLFVRLTKEARTRNGLGPARHRDYGFGLAPAPDPERAAARFDFFLRAHRERLETWFAFMTIYQLRDMRETLVATAEAAGIMPPRSANARIHASLVVPDLAAITIELRAESIDDVFAGADTALRTALPEAARWDPTFAGGVMVLVGPLELGSHARADACLAHVKATVKSLIPGKPRAIEAMFAARSR